MMPMRIVGVIFRSSVLCCFQWPERMRWPACLLVPHFALDGKAMTPAQSRPLRRQDSRPWCPSSHHRPRSAGYGWATRRVDLSRSEEHTSELQSLMRIPYPVFCLKKKITTSIQHLHATAYFLLHLDVFTIIDIY